MTTLNASTRRLRHDASVFALAGTQAATQGASGRPRRQVTLQALTANERLLGGILRAANEFGWSMDLSMLMQSDPPPSWKADGAIRLSHRFLDLAAPIHGFDTPTVLIGRPPEMLSPEVSCVDYDIQSVVSIALDHFISHNYTSVGYVDCYRGTSRYESHECEMLASLSQNHGLRFRAFALDDLPAELRDETQPVALMTVTTAQAQRVIDVCQRHGIAVPDEVAVAGVWDNPLLCNACQVPITAIDLDEDRMGYEAGRTLEAMLAGEPYPKQTHIPAIRIVPRQSTAIVGIGTPAVRKAVKFIQSRYQDGIQVDDVIQSVNSGRTTLYREFKRCLGRSIAQYISQVRVEQAKRVLIETDWTLDRVALEVGLESRCSLHHSFTRMVGKSPGEFRRVRCASAS